MLKKTISMILALAMVLSMLPVTAFAENPVKVTLTADKNEVAPGEEIVLTLSIDQKIENAYIWQWNIMWNSELFDVVTIARGTAYNRSSVNKEATVNLPMPYKASSVTSGSSMNLHTLNAGTLCTLTLRAKDTVSEAAAKFYVNCDTIETGEEYEDESGNWVTQGTAYTNITTDYAWGSDYNTLPGETDVYFPVSIKAPSSGDDSGSTTSSDYEIWYELDETAPDTENNNVGDNYKEYDISTDAGKKVTATLCIKNKGTAPVSLQAYDIYLTHDSKLTAGQFSAEGIGTNAKVGTTTTDITGGKQTRIQAIGQSTGSADININLPAAGEPDNAVALGTITFTIEDSAIYNTPMNITLTRGSAAQGETSTNIGIADYKTDGTTTGNKESKYPSVGGTTDGAEVMTTYDVTYNANGGTWGEGVEDPIQEKQYNVDLTLDPGKTPTRTGYEFLGWSTDSGDNNAVNAGTTYTANEDEVFYAVWNQTSFTVEWFGTDGTVIETDNNVAYGATAEFNGTEPSKTVEGYTVEFLGWNTDPDAVAALTDLKITGATQFYPIFKETINQYEVTFDADGGTLADGASTTVKQDYNTPITLPNATKTGHTLEGWYDGATKVGAAGDSYTIKKDVELKAEWTVDTYTIKYMDGTTEMTGLTPTSYTYGETKTLPTPTKEGATFGGWYTVANPGENDSVVTTITATDIGNKTFYAKWTNNTYTIAAVADPTEGGTVSAVNSEDKTTSANLNDTINVTVTPQPGYDIDKVTWAPENGNAKDIEITDGSGSFTMPAANVTVTATFKKVDLAVTKDAAIDSDEGSVTVKKNDESTETDKAQIEDTINLTVTPEKGYQVTEVSYTYTKDGEEVKATITDPVNNVYTFEMPGYPVEVSAIFEPIEYNITYMDGESKIENLSPAKYTVESEQITLPSATKAGYNFIGWYTEPEFTNVVTTLDPADAEDKTYYAKFEIIEYTITYMDGNDQISGLSPSKYTVVDGTVTLATYNKNGYTFGGWFESSDCTGTAITSFASTEVGGKLYYAKLTPIEYTITFVVPNGTAIADQTYTVESEYTLPEATNSNSLYTFKNWLASDAEGSWTNTEYNKGTEVKGKYGDVTLTAQWNEKLTYEIQEYKYAGSNQLMLLIASESDTNTNAYTFSGETMFYSADTGYQIDKIENETTVKKNVFVTLISSEYVQTVDGIKRLTADGMAKVGPGTAAAADIRINGDINNDSVVNIADANIVYQMIVNGGGYYSADLLTADRLAADMVKDDNAVHRAAINDVNEIVNKINGTTTTNP
ncbi:MAG: InlB B-repeat-containing protein [Bacteroidaceae bacterium]|nr:InlB B-repeat-containing protein [Bacteroidaceae bacterium]